ncbi:MAG TPA: ATP-dependent Clp protease proteolytic subunit [Acidimicrobiales bacterium]|jgi:ATP-dependent Clp protease protease subunit|nr:ATP-dependent Clp protease proteolytic subunit [Acidimicrobiales bacterium]
MGSNDWPDGADWLEGHLFDRRIVTLRGPLDDAGATRVASQLMTLDATGDEAVDLQLDSPGGSLEACFSVVDVIDVLGVPVNVTCLGRVEGPAVLVAAVCSKRLAMEHTRFRLSDPDVVFEARASHIGSLLEFHRQNYLRYHERLARAVGRPTEAVAEACEEGRFFSAAEAVAFGLVDDVVRSKRAPLRALPPH